MKLEIDTVPGRSAFYMVKECRSTRRHRQIDVLLLFNMLLPARPQIKLCSTRHAVVPLACKLATTASRQGRIAVCPSPCEGSKDRTEEKGQSSGNTSMTLPVLNCPLSCLIFLLSLTRFIAQCRCRASSLQLKRARTTSDHGELPLLTCP